MKNETTQYSALITTPATAGKAARLSPEDEARTFEAFSSAWGKNDKKNYNKHFERLFAAYRPLAMFIARKYEKLGIDAADIAAEVDYALCKAIKDYRDDKGTKFTTFATSRINFAILEAFNGEFRTISVPRNRTKILDKMRKAEISFTAAHNRQPTQNELMAAAGISKREMESAKEIDFKYSSLNMEIKDGDGACLGDFLEDKQASSPWAELDNAQISKVILKAVSQLSARERWVLTHRTLPMAQGLDSAMTLEEIGKRLKISKVSARNIEKRAMASLCAIREMRELAREIGIVA